MCQHGDTIMYEIRLVPDFMQLTAVETKMILHGRISKSVPQVPQELKTKYDASNPRKSN